MDNLAVGITDKSVEEDSDALVTPDTQELVYFVEAIWSGHGEAVVDTREITQVKDVVELGRRRRQLMNSRSAQTTLAYIGRF